MAVVGTSVVARGEPGLRLPNVFPADAQDGRSDGFVGFMEEDEKPFRTRWEESEAGAWSAPATHIQQRYNAYAPPRSASRRRGRRELCLHHAAARGDAGGRPGGDAADAD